MIKSSVELNRLLLKFIVKSDEYSRNFSQRQCKIKLSRENLKHQNVMEKDFSGFQRT